MAGRNLENAEARAARLAAKLAAVEELLDQHQRTVLEQVSKLEEKRRLLCESEQRYRSLFESSHDAIMTLEPPSWMFTSGNQATLTMFRVKGAEEFISCPHWKLSPERQPDGRASNEKAKEMIETAMREGSNFFAWTHKRLNGEEFPATVLLTRMERAGTERAGMEFLQATIRDVTELRQAEKALIRAARTAAVGTLSAGLAHQFNNLNMGILGYAQLAMTDPCIQKQTLGFLQEVCKSTARAKEIIDNLLAFTGQRVCEQKPGNLARLVDQTLELMTSDLVQRGIEVLKKLEPTPEIAMNAGEIGQVLLNLLMNANHSLVDRPVRRITIETGTASGWIWAKISDTGCGIPAAILSRIFAPFFTTKGEHATPGSPQESVRGTGLGLSVSLTLVARHGGEIRVASEVGIGSTFTVRLPVGGKGAV